MQGIKRVIAPHHNEKDLIDIPDYVQKDIEFTFVKQMAEVLELALIDSPQPLQPKTLHPIHFPGLA